MPRRNMPPVFIHAPDGPGASASRLSAIATAMATRITATKGVALPSQYKSPNDFLRKTRPTPTRRGTPRTRRRQPLHAALDSHYRRRCGFLACVWRPRHSLPDIHGRKAVRVQVALLTLGRNLPKGSAPRCEAGTAGFPSRCEYRHTRLAFPKEGSSLFVALVRR